MTLDKFILTVCSVIRNMQLFSSKKSGYKLPPRSKVKNYGQRQTVWRSWLVLIKRRFSSFSLSRKRSHLSRAEKRKIVRKKTVKVLLSIGVFLFVLVMLKKPVQNFVTSLQLFQIKDIVITGNRISRSSEIKSMAGFDYNTSILDISPEEVKALLMKHPWIKSAKVERRWPNGITILIREHNVEALLVKGSPREEKFYYINRAGVPIVVVQAGQEIDFPVITGFNGLQEEERGALLQDAITFLKLIRNNNPNLPAQSVSEIHMDKTRGMVVHLVEFPFPIYFGRGEVKNKYNKLLKILAVLYKKKKGNVDIGEVKYIRMDYLEKKVLVAKTRSG